MCNFRLRIGVFQSQRESTGGMIISASEAVRKERKDRVSVRQRRVPVLENASGKRRPYWAHLATVAGVGFVRAASQGNAISDDAGFMESGVGKAARYGIPGWVTADRA
jgi:hypothetical protein